MVTLEALPEFAPADADAPETRALPNAARWVIRLAPGDAPNTRPPLRLVLALDVSGSMSGEPIEGAVMSARGVARALSSHDELAIVTFGSQVQTLIPPQTMVPGAVSRIEQVLSRLTADGGTDLAGGMLAAMETANANGQQGRVLLLTDGQPTVGLTDVRGIIQLAQLRVGSSTLSTFGFGRGVSADLLSELADAGRGNYSFIEGGETPVQAIGAELGGLLTTVAFSVQVRITPHDGTCVAHVARVAGSIAKEGSAVALQLTSLVANEPVFVPIVLAPIDRANRSVAATIHLQYRDATDGDLHEQTLVLDAPLARSNVRVPEASHAILLSAIADAIGTIGQKDIDVQKAFSELQATAKDWGFEHDAAINAALATLAATMSAAGSQAEDAQNRVAAARSVYTRRSTMTGVAGYKSAEGMSASQLTGTALLIKQLEALKAAHAGEEPAQNAPSENTRDAVFKVGVQALLGKAFGKKKPGGDA